ncbi:MAG: PfkB family carbohydrate kinase, partial [Terracidiphilus sp.]
MPDAIFVGLSTIDIVYRVDRFPTPNTKIAAQSQNIYAGGPAANAAIACAHLGAESALVTTVGRHPLAALIREELARYSVQLIDLNPVFEDVPPLSSISVDQAGNRSVVSANAVGLPTPPVSIDHQFCRQAKILMVDGHH